MGVAVAVVSATCVAVVATTTGPRRDLDYWWHVLLGRALINRVPSSASSWSVWPGDPDWRTAQPLAEMALATADRWWPASAPATVRATTAALAMTTLVIATRPWRADPLPVVLGRWWVFAWGSVAVFGFTQERPAQVGLICMPLVGMLAAWWATGRLASRRAWLLFGSVSTVTAALWTLSHQSWLLAWSVLLTAVALSPRPWSTRTAALAMLAGVFAWAWWWLGPPWRALLTAEAASSLAEWQPTGFFTIPGAPATALVLGCAAAIAQSLLSPKGQRWHTGDASRYATLLVLGLAGASAWRHVPVTVLAAGPVLISLLLIRSGVGPTPERQREDPRHRPRSSPALVIGLPLVCGVAAVHLAAQLQPAQATQADRVATLAARHACGLPVPAVIATHYNDSGPALAGARSADCPQAAAARVVIDGRADRYGADALERWQRVLSAEGRRWEQDWHAVDPDIAILAADSRLHRALLERGWAQSEVDHGLVVLKRPGAPLRSPLGQGVGVDAIKQVGESL